MLIEKTNNPDGLMTKFGPQDPETGRQLEIPSSFERKIQDLQSGLKITISCNFDGQLVVVNQLSVATDIDGGITSRVIAQLGLPALIHEVTTSVCPDWEFWSADRLNGERIENSAYNYAFLAQVYWLHHVSHGSPRQELMRMLDIPRSSCNLLLRRIKLAYELPKT